MANVDEQSFTNGQLSQHNYTNNEHSWNGSRPIKLVDQNELFIIGYLLFLYPGWKELDVQQCQVPTTL